MNIKGDVTREVLDEVAKQIWGPDVSTTILDQKYKRGKILQIYFEDEYGSSQTAQEVIMQIPGDNLNYIAIQIALIYYRFQFHFQVQGAMDARAAKDEAERSSASTLQSGEDVPGGTPPAEEDS